MELDVVSVRVAQAIATALGHALKSEGPLRVRFFPAAIEGDIDWATVELTHGGGFRVLGAVFDLGPHCTVALMGERDGRTAIVGRTGAEAAPEQVGAAMAGWVQGGGLTRVPVTAFDVACDALPLLAREVVVPGTWWRAGFWGEWDTHPAAGATGASVELGGEDGGRSLVTVYQHDPGVELAVGTGALSPRTQQAANSVEDAARALEAAVGGVRAALAARAAYRARPFPLQRAGEILFEGLRDAGVATQAWRLKVREHYPYDYPDGVIERHDDVGHHVEVTFSESERGVQIWPREGPEKTNWPREGPEKTNSVGRYSATCASEDALRAVLPDLVVATREHRRALTPDKLAPGTSYRARKAFSGIPIGEELLFVELELIPREDFSCYHFRRAGTGARFTLSDAFDDDLEVLRHLSEHLERVR